MAGSGRRKVDRGAALGAPSLGVDGLATFLYSTFFFSNFFFLFYIPWGDERCAHEHDRIRFQIYAWIGMGNIRMGRGCKGQMHIYIYYSHREVIYDQSYFRFARVRAGVRIRVCLLVRCSFLAVLSVPGAFASNLVLEPTKAVARCCVRKPGGRSIARHRMFCIGSTRFFCGNLQ